MKLQYTEIGQDLTKLLTQEAWTYANQGKRVFYIAPNSLSFEKERKVLEFLPNRASFTITITRFAQMARYFMLKEKDDGQSLDEIGLSMVFYQVMSQMPEESLKRYGQLRKDGTFIKQLVSLYQELAKTQLTPLDLEGMEEQKKEDLTAIFSDVNRFLQEKALQFKSPLTSFSQAMMAGHLDSQLADVVIIVDGFTRFSVEEELLISQLNARCHEVVLGTYASQKAYKAQYRQGNVYEASVDFLRHLAELFQTKPVFIASSKTENRFSLLSDKVEAVYDFQTEESPLPAADFPVVLWEASTQKAELEAVARDVRAKLFDGYRYKDILVLLGDVDAYHLQLSQIFKRYSIPYYLGKAESMAHHPLVHFVESLERLKRYRFRAEDLINLLKSGLYGSLTMDDIDLFEQYVRFADLKGLTAFQKPFTHNKDNRFNLEYLNQLRQELMAPLESLFKTNRTTAQTLLKKWTSFLQEAKLTANLAKLANRDSVLNAERHEEVWRVFTQLLDTFQTIFRSERLSLAEFLSLLTTGLQGADYRVVPATVDVVTVKSYDLIEPHTNKLVYAIGLTQGNFLKVAKNTSLISDDERSQINANLEDKRLEVASQENQKKNRFVLMSLLHAASEQLVLSSPRLYQEGEDGRSTYLQLLAKLGLPVRELGQEGAKVEDLGSYYGLLSRLVDFYQADIKAEDLSQEEQTFWSVAIRVLKKKLAKEGLDLPHLSDDLAVSPVSEEVMLKRYPKTDVFQLSASALMIFYNNEYAYFLRYVLGLQEDISIHPDMRNYGNFLHRVFELVLKNQSDLDFDTKLQQAIQETKSEPENALVYGRDAQSQYTQGVLDDIAQATSLVLREQSVVDVVAEEAIFGKDNTNSLTLSNGYQLNIRGKIDRLDRLKSEASYGVVDYKSSDKTFNLSQFYNKLSPQLMTYITALKNDQSIQAEQVFGAMYLHIQEPLVQLQKTKSSEDVLAHAHQELRYKGLFLDSQTNLLNRTYASSRSQFTAEEFELMVAYTLKLYQTAAEKILSGDFAINPYTKDGQTVLGEQFKAITGFEANRHMSHARVLTHFPRKEQKEAIFEAMKGVLDL